MCKPVVLVLAIVAFASTSSIAREPSTLSAPRFLGMGSISDTAVVLQWDLDIPQDVSLSDVGFQLRLDQWPQAIVVHFETEPLSYTFDGLRPGRSYTVYLLASCAYCHDSPPVNTKFTTMGEDWPAPIITGVSPPLDDVTYYEITWRLQLRRQLFYIKIEICDPKCIEYTEQPTANSTFVPIPSHVMFTVRLCALYSEHLVGRIQRYSDYFRVYPSITARDVFSRWINIEGRENGSKVIWHTDLSPVGARSYFEFFVCDPSLQSGDEKSAEMLSDELTTPHPESIRIDEEVEIIDEGLNQKLRSLSKSEQSCKPSQLNDNAVFKTPDRVECLNAGEGCIPRLGYHEKPVLFKIIKKMQKALRFRIVFSTYTTGSFGSEIANPPKRLLLGPSLARTLNLPPFKPIHFLIRTCSSYPKAAIDNCGNFTASDIISSVAEPSAVRDATQRIVARGLLEISWQEPAEPRGPIDGYKIMIHRMDGDKTRSTSIYIPRYQRSMFLPRPVGGYGEYLFSIAAFNLDHDGGGGELMGEWVQVQRDGPQYVHATMWMLCVAIFAILVGIFGGKFWFAKKHSRRRVHQLSLPQQPFGVDVDRNQFREELRQMRPPPLRFRVTLPEQVVEEESSL